MRGLPITSLKQRRISEEAADQLREAIYSGRLKPGDKLPPERALARQFGISRLMLREALRFLEQAGHLVIRRGYGGGAFVSEIDRQAATRSLSAMIRLGETSVDDLTETRLIYEPQIARLAAERASAADMARIEGHIEQRKAEFPSRTFGHPTNLSFHRLIAEATRNPVLVMLVDAVMEPVRESIQHLKMPRGADRKMLSVHERLYRAIKARNPQLAHRIMAQHVVDFRAMMRQALAKSARGEGLRAETVRPGAGMSFG